MDMLQQACNITTFHFAIFWKVTVLNLKQFRPNDSVEYEKSQESNLPLSRINLPTMQFWVLFLQQMMPSIKRNRLQIRLANIYLPATLLAESLLSTTNGNLRCLWVNFTDFMSPVIVSAQTQISITTVDQAMSNLSHIAWSLGPFWRPRKGWSFHRK